MRTIALFLIAFLYSIGYALCALQAYISMYEYKEGISSTCIRCSYINDVFMVTLFFYLFFLFIYFLFFISIYFLSKKKIKDIYKVIPITVIFAATCFLEGFIFHLCFLFIYLYFLFIYFLSKAETANGIYKIIPIMVIYVATCFTVNEEIFFSRHASWSTYSAMEESAAVISNSFIAIAITATIFYCLIKYLDKKYKPFVTVLEKEFPFKGRLQL